MPARRYTLLLVAVANLAETAHLVWEHGHGGIRANRLLVIAAISSAANGMWRLLRGYWRR